MKKKGKGKYKFQHLSLLYRNTNWVYRDNPYPEYYQFPDDREDFRDVIDREHVAERFRIMLETLTERERRVIYCRFYKQLTLEQTAENFTVAKERIRQIEAKALRKLRHPRRYAMVLEPEELKERERRRLEREKEQERLELEREAQRKREYDEWWEREGKAEHEERERIRKEAKARREVEAARSNEMSEMHRRAREAYERKQQAQREARLIEDLKAQYVAAVTATKQNDDRPYIWDAYQKKRRYLNERGEYE